MGLGLDGFLAGWGGVLLRVKMGLGLDGFSAGCSGVLAQGEHGFGFGWVVSRMGWRFSSG